MCYVVLLVLQLAFSVRFSTAGGAHADSFLPAARPCHAAVEQLDTVHTINVQWYCYILTCVGACPTQPGTPNWIDSSTSAEACTKSICTGSYAQCTGPASAKEDMVLVFSDEFNKPTRDFLGQGGDKTWTAMDMYYSSDFAELQNYKPDKVKVAGGALQLTMNEETTKGAPGTQTHNHNTAVMQLLPRPQLVKVMHLLPNLAQHEWLSLQSERYRRS